MKRINKTYFKSKKRYSSKGNIFNYKKKKCSECGETFKPNTNIAKYCSLTCQNINRRKRKSEWIRKYNLEYSRKNPIKTKEWKSKYSKKWIMENPERYNAGIKARNKTKLKDSCEICSSRNNLERHHWDYKKPLSVNTLCKSCHKIQHIKEFNKSCHGRIR